MDISVEQISDVRTKVDVQIPWNEVKGRLDDAYKELGTGVTLKGFRKGKVPRQMLERMFGKHVHKEVAQRLVQESMGQALTEKDISPIAEPEVEDDGIENGNPFCYSAVLEVVPELEIKGYEGIEVTQRPAAVSDEKLQETLAARQKELTQYRAIEGRNTQEGDVLTIDLLGKIGTQPVALEDHRLELGDSSTEVLPGLTEKLTGISTDEEEISIELTVPDRDGGEQQARLLVTLKQVQEKLIPALDDEFAKDTGEAETLAELTEKVRGQLLEADEQRAREEAKRSLAKLIVDCNEIPSIPALAEQQLQRMVEMQRMLMGLSDGAGGLDIDALKERMRDDAEQTVKESLMLKAAAKQEKVEVNEADLEKRYAEIAASREQNVAKIRSEYQKEGRLEALRGSLLEEKTLDLLMTKAKIITKELADSAEE